MLLFLCGSLEPGKSGVGDYTLQLARALHQTIGISSHIVALHDAYVTEKTEFTDKQCSAIQLHRLPDTLPSKTWKQYLDPIVEQYRPAWISLQYVGYAYNRFGLATPVTRLLRKYGNATTKTHIMFHELWEGFGIQEGMKQHFRGCFQKRSVRQLLKPLPSVCHTQNHFYLAQLQQIFPSATYLPLFGNIPIHSAKAQKVYELIKGRTAFDLNEHNRSETLMFAFFGSIYPNWPMDTFLDQINQVVKKTQKHVMILSLGNLGQTRSEWEKLVARQSDHFRCLELGFLDENEISEILLEIDYGVATTPFEGLGKSGSFVAMQEHGKIVFGGRNMLKTRYSKNVTKFEPNSRPMVSLYEAVIGEQQASHFGSRLQETTDTMIQDLELQ